MMVPVSAMSILVVDHEPLVLETLEMLLTFDGHRVEAASDGESALKKFALQDFDIVFTDQAKGCLLLADRLYGCSAFVALVLDRCQKIGSHFLTRARPNIKGRVVRRLCECS